MSTLILGHRGASGYAPENTLEAFSLALEQGADGVELDVHFTRDNEIVVTHDERIDRVANDVGRVKDFTLKELKALSFNKTHPEWENAKIPTLAEVFELFKPTNAIINIELKNSCLPYEGLENACLKLASRFGMEGRVIYSSFNHHSMLRLKKLDSSAVCGLLYDCTLINPWLYCKNLGMNALHPHHSELVFAPDECQRAHELGLKVNTWTVNDEVSMRYCFEKGADSIITNYPDRAVRLLEGMNLKQIKIAQP